MGNARSTKRDIERARLEKAAAKRERRQGRGEVDDVAPGPEPASPHESQESVLAALAALHQRFEAGSMPFADFESQKNELTLRLQVD